MWDAKYVYLAAHWKDPTPMYNTVDPDFNPTEGWKSDAWQMRIKSDKNCWITTWYFTPKKMPLMSIDDWKNPARDKDGLDNTLLRGEPGKPDMGKGVQMVYKADADGKGFVQEMRLPWSVIYRQPPEAKAGNVFRMGMEFLWGDPSGNTWPVHRYADNMQPGQTSREFFWTAVNSWGDMKLVDKGNLPVRQYVDEEAKIHGSVPVRVTVPKTAARFTVAINDASGKRIRNLGGDLLVDDYLDPAAKPAADGGKTVVVDWDCLDDRGRLANEGKYNVVALSHNGLGAEYQMCFYNPGTPPWDSRNGSGAWGADHATPLLRGRRGRLDDRLLGLRRGRARDHRHRPQRTETLGREARRHATCGRRPKRLRRRQCLAGQGRPLPPRRPHRGVQALHRRRKGPSLRSQVVRDLRRVRRFERRHHCTGRRRGQTPRGPQER
jgi:hypothetical protein